MFVNSIKLFIKEAVKVWTETSVTGSLEWFVKIYYIRPFMLMFNKKVACNFDHKEHVLL